MKRYIKFASLFFAILTAVFLTGDFYVKKNSLDEFDVIIDSKLLGNENITLQINEKYIELGVLFKINDKPGNIKISGFVDSNKIGEYKIKYEYFISDFKVDTKYRNIKVVDTISPKIVLKGKKIYKLAQNSKYIEPGYTIFDNSNEDLNKLIKIEGKVDTSKPGSYKIKYLVSDSQGNKAEETREVVVQRVISTKNVKITKTTTEQKGLNTTTKLNLTGDTNNITSMKFTSTGINVTGYVKNASDKYIIKICNSSNDCINTDMNVKNTNYYTGNIKLSELENGIYTMKLLARTEMNIINRLGEFERIYRSKVGNKLVTITYPSSNPMIKVENFTYKYDILIDAGHGGTDPGAANSTITEKALNLKQSQYEKSRYEAHGLKVFMIRNDDTYGVMMGSSSENYIRRRAYAIGYYGTVSKISYSNHHNSIDNKYFSGWEIISPTLASSTQLSTELKIANIWDDEYPTTDIHTRFYGRNYDTSSILNKRSGQTYNVKNYYAVIRIPYELFNVKNILYEGCYLSNPSDFKWYYTNNNWKKMSEIKIKHYVESLDIKYILP